MYSIYALKQGEEVVYVGRTKNIKRRIRDHKRSKEFDSFEVFITTDSLKNAKELEDMHIILNDPIYNKSLNAGGHYISLNEETKGKIYDIPKLIMLCNYYEIKPVFKDKYQDYKVLNILEECEIK